MRRRSLTSIFAITLTILFTIGAEVLAQEAETTQPKKKPTMKPVAQSQPTTQSQPATQKGKSGDAKSKGKAPMDPKQAGWVTVHGRILTVHAEQNSLIIQGDTTQYLVHFNAQSQILRDGRPAELKAIKANDRVDGCHFNAKHVVQSLKVTSAENVLQIHPKPDDQ
jgi:hypothetical protein